MIVVLFEITHDYFRSYPGNNGNNNHSHDKLLLSQEKFLFTIENSLIITKPQNQSRFSNAQFILFKGGLKKAGKYFILLLRSICFS